MRMLRAILAGAMLVTAGQSVAAAGDDADWQLFGRVLSLVQSVAHVAAQSNDPRAVERQVEHLLSGRNTEANRLAGDLIGDAFEDMPARYRGTVLALANDFAAIARKDRARQSATQAPGSEGALQARKDLASIGLRYYDAVQFLDAVKRDDRLAVELFVAARGVDIATRDSDGVNALEHAQRRNHRAIAELLATARR